MVRSEAAVVVTMWLCTWQAVAAHEKQMREQAKKMNVASLRSADQANTSAKCKLAKVRHCTDTKLFG
jgi:r-opsin